MPIKFDSYDQLQIDSLKTVLDSNVELGRPKSYEIHVDQTKAVSKTTDVNQFYKYEDFMTPSTCSVRFVFFCPNNSPRNDQYVFVLKANSPQDALNKGLDGVVHQVFNKKD